MGRSVTSAGRRDQEEGTPKPRKTLAQSSLCREETPGLPSFPPPVSTVLSTDQGAWGQHSLCEAKTDPQDRSPHIALTPVLPRGMQSRPHTQGQGRKSCSGRSPWCPGGLGRLRGGGDAGSSWPAALWAGADLPGTLAAGLLTPSRPHRAPLRRRPRVPGLLLRRAGENYSPPEAGPS